MDDDLPPGLSAELPPPLRLAVAYAPRSARRMWTALLVLDRRLARVVLQAREPMLAQLRLAWWRDRFRSPASAWPEGEPLLAALAPLDGERAALEALTDAWERILGGEAADADLAAVVDARSAAIVALGRALGCDGSADRVAAMARFWASSDLTEALSDGQAFSPAGVSAIRPARLPRAMRPLVVLAGLHDRPRFGTGIGRLLRIVRLGLLGR